jgi:hypothetical protein
VSIPVPVFLVFLGPIIPAHLIAILGANGGELFSKRKQPYEFGRSWKYAFASLKFIPVPWRVFGLAFWYIYMPAAAIISFNLNNHPAFAGLVTAAFSLVHFLSFRFVLPQRDLIIQSVSKMGKT